MIQVIPTHITKYRTFGWVQDPSNFRSLCDVVAVFDFKSAKHKELVDTILPSLVDERDGRSDLIAAMSTRPLKIEYAKLVGTSFMPRTSARCNGIIQATVKGQKRPFIGDWPADNFVRWAQAFGFIKFNHADDTFEITDNGKELVQADDGAEELSIKEKELLVNAILAYPPAVRILNLLAEDDAHLTKYEIGKQLGFVGEDGFTSLPQSVLVRTLATTEDRKEINKMKTDWDGSADKYARMTAKWLCKLDFVEQVAKKVSVLSAGVEYSAEIGQAYMITAAGVAALNRTVGRSRHKRISKNIYFEMLATKGEDREYLRTRRAYIIKFLSENNHSVNAEDIVDYLKTVGLNENIETVKDDIQGIINIGLSINCNDGNYTWNDSINDFIIPLPQSLAKSELSEVKDDVRAKLTHLSHEYLSLIDIAYDSSQNRLFEMKTIELLTDECAFEGLHLGGSRKPDGIVYSTDLARNFGMIIDTKAYQGGYNLPISQADEMGRYIRENQTRNVDINPNKWWENFGADIADFSFMFVSGHFIGNFASQLERISRETNTNGTALAVANLLLCANEVKSGAIGQQWIRDNMFRNVEFVM